MQRFLNPLILRTLRFRRLSVRQPARVARSRKDHIRLCRAIEEQDGELARALVRSNLAGAFKAVQPLLQSGGEKS